MSGFDWFNLSPAWNEFSVRLSLTLLHSLWQGIVIAAIAAMALRWLRRSSANSRYIVAGLALLCLPISAAITYSTVEVPTGLARQDVPQLSEISSVDDASATASVDPPMFQTFESRPSSVSEPRPESASLIADIPVVPIESEKVVANHWLTPLLPWLSTAYLIGVIAMLIRLLLGVWGGFRLRSQSTLATETGLLSVVGELSTKLGLKLAPTIYYCERVAAPAVIGILKPAILLPASMVTSLSPTELAAILSHELAHIRRGDLALQFVQRSIEMLFFFHPATWWLSARVNDERENCCDDLAASAGFGNIGYATALLRVAELCLSKKPSQVFSPVGVLSADGSNSRQLSRRIERQLNMNSSPRLGSRLSFVLIALIAVCGIASVGAMTLKPTETAMVALKPTFNSAVILESEMDDAPAAVAIADEKTDTINAAEFTPATLKQALTSRDLQFDNMTVVYQTSSVKVGVIATKESQQATLSTFGVQPEGKRVEAKVTTEYRLTIRGDETTIDVDEHVEGSVDLGFIPQRTRTSNSSGKELIRQLIPNSEEKKIPDQDLVSHYGDEPPNGLLEQDQMFAELCLGIGYGKRMKEVTSIMQAGPNLEIEATLLLYDGLPDISRATLIVDSNLLVRKATLWTRDESDGLMSEIITDGILPGLPPERFVARTSTHKRRNFWTERGGKKRNGELINADYETVSIKFELSDEEYATLSAIDMDAADMVMDLSPKP